MTQTTPKTLQEHERLELIRRLEAQDFIFAQNPKLVTDTLKGDNHAAYDKLFIRAEKIDSDGHLLDAIASTHQMIASSKRLIYIVYFVLGMVGVAGILASSVVNFFYVLVALLGWHSLSLLWWLIGLARPKHSLLTSFFDKLTLQSPIASGVLPSNHTANKTAQKTALGVVLDSIRPVKSWYLSTIMHGAWLSGLVGSMVGLFGLFLFRRYGFGFESTLLTDAHFYEILAVIGYLPAKLGLVLPTASDGTPAQFAYLVLACLVLYGLLPRLMAYLYCRLKSVVSVHTDINQPYYQALMAQFSQTIIDHDDYQAPSVTPIRPISDTPHERLIKATLERADADHVMTLSVLSDAGVVDTRDELIALINECDSHDAQLYLGIDTSTPPDRGILRKIHTLQQIRHGIIVTWLGKPTHINAWQIAMNERGILVV